MKNRGLVDLKIPLISVKEGEFDESISLGYNSSGFMPAKRDGIVGMDWHLNVGGAITRTVKGVPDEHKGQAHIDGGALNGFYYGVTRYPMSELDVYSFSSTTGHAEADHLWERQPPGTPTGDAFESQPDDFSFNFHGISGKFFFNNQGGVEVIPNQPVHIEVDLSNFQEQDIPSKSIPKSSEIIFKVDNGYTYYFGGEHENVEFTIGIQSPIQHSNIYSVAPAVINTWHLTKVVAPSGREMIYEYEGAMRDSDGHIEDEFTQFMSLKSGNSSNHLEFESARQSGAFRPIVLNKQVNQYRNFDQIDVHFFGQDFVGYAGGAGDMGPLYEVSKQSYLSSITSPDFIIRFTYSVKGHQFYNRPNELETHFNDLYNFKDKQLDQVHLFWKEGVGGDLTGDLQIQTFNFEYEEHSNRNFLMSVQEVGKEPYTMEYNSNDNLPYPDTHGIDHWGFWKGGNSNTSELIPQFLSNRITGDRNYNHSSNIDYRASAGVCDRALLNKITYPTSGYSEFTYEPHMYSRRIDRVSAHNFLPSLETVSNEVRAGGARIRTIVDFDGDATTNTRHFYYINNYIPDENSSEYDDTSSGILLNWPRYTYYVKFYGDGYESTMFRSKSTSFNRNSYDGFHMSYSKVVEVFDNGGYTMSRFSDYETHGDKAGDYNELDVDPLISGVSIDPAVPANLYKNYIGMEFNDTSIERGELLTESHFDNSGNIVLKKEYEYNEDPNRWDDFVTQIHGPGGFWIQATKRYLYTNFLTKERTLSYDQNSVNNALVSENE